MADLTQSSATTETTAPDWYTNSMKNLAAGASQYGVGGANAPAYVGATDLQNKAWNLASANQGTYQPGLNASNALINQGANVDITGAANPYLQAGTSSSADLVGGYMNPYINNVVDQIRQANQQNIAQNLSPGITAGAVGSGQFGSQRGANALALGVSNANIGALAQQAAALQSGYSDALKAAQAQRLNQVNAGQIAGNMATQEAQKYRDLATSRMNLANQEQTQGIADVNQLATMGAQKQQIEQNRQLFPLDVLNKQASLLSGAQVPMTTTSTMTGSPLSMISGLGATAAGLFTPKTTIDPVTNKPVTTTPWAELTGALKSGLGTLTGGGTTTPTTTPPPITLPTTNPGGGLTTPGSTPPPNTNAPIPNNLSPTGYSDLRGNPVNADGTTYTGGDTTPTGHWETDDDGNMTWVEDQ